MGARAVYELALAPVHTAAVAELLENIVPYMVTAIVNGRRRSILDEVVSLCQESLATVHSDCVESVYASVMLLSHLFKRNLVPLVLVKDLFMFLLFLEDDELPEPHAVTLACLVMVECSTAIKENANGAKMIDILIFRLKELKGHNYPEDTTKAISAAVDFEVRQSREKKEAEERAAAVARKAQRSMARN